MYFVPQTYNLATGVVLPKFYLQLGYFFWRPFGLEM